MDRKVHQKKDLNISKVSTNYDRNTLKQISVKKFIDSSETAIFSYLI